MDSPQATADPWAQLTKLGEEARKDNASKLLFAAALRDFHQAGWTYRQLAKPNGVSHEFIRLAILDLPEDAPPSAGIPVPVRTRRLDIIPIRELDPQITAELKRRLAAAVEADPADKTPSGIKPAVSDFFAALHAAAGAGWDAYSLAHSLGSHPKAVFKFIAQHERYGEGEPPMVPAAPHQDEQTLWRASRPALPPVTVPDDDMQQLQALEADAFADTTAHAAETKRYLALLGAWYLLGANRDELERATGQNWETIRKRLVRGGYMAGRPRSVQQQPDT